MDVVEDIYEPLAEMYMVCFAASHEGIDDCRIFCRCVITAKQVVFTAKRYRTDAILNQVVVNQILSIKEIAFQYGILIAGIFDSLSNGALRAILLDIHATSTFQRM